MTRQEQLVQEIRDYCAAHANPELAAKYARYFKEGYDSWGLMDSKSPIWNEQKEEWTRRYNSLGLKGFLRLGEMLFTSGKYEEASFAFEFAMDLRDTYTPRSFQRIGKWIDSGIRNWGHTEAFSGSVLANFITDGVVGLDAQVVDARLVAAGGDGEVDRRVFEHPLRVVAFDARRLRRE